MSTQQQYVIASLKHTIKNHEHITFWGPNYRGYVLVVKDDHVGTYSAEFIAKDGGHLNDGESCIAVPLEAVKALLSPEPFYACGGKAARFYDTPGPVVDNTRKNWNALIAASMTEHRRGKPKPEVFRGQRRSFAMHMQLAWTAARAPLLERMAELEADAARYRWLRRFDHFAHVDAMLDTTEYNTLDAAVDAARSGSAS